MLAKFAIRLVAGLILIPIGLVLGAVVLVAGGLAASLVFFPLLLLAALAWFLFRGATRLSPV